VKAVVAGAGIFGVTASLTLRERGWDVILVDPGPIPHPLAASTDISKLVRMDYGSDDLYFDLMDEAFAGWDAWNREFAAPAYHEDGFLLLAKDPFEDGRFEAESLRRVLARGVPAGRLDRAAIRARFPAWNADVYADGYFNPRAGWAESGRVVAELVARATAAGIDVRPGIRIDGLIERGGRVLGVRTSAGDLRADVVIACVGTWTPAVIPELASVMVSTGQPVFHLQVEPGEFRPPAFAPWAADIARTGWYGFPALADGTLKVANHGPGRRLHPDAPRVVTADDEAHLRGFLAESLPSIAEAPVIRTRLCLYSDTVDGDFWIDRDPRREGLVVAAGGSGHAFKFAPVLGRLIADAVDGRKDRFLERFAWRVPQKHAEDARFTG
jgi:glycine/D-amino acid oxidase-like deaminating enzyme